MSYYYQSGLTGETVPLDVPESLAGFQGEMRGHVFDYDMTARDIDSPYLGPNEVTVPFTGTWEGLDRLLELADADVRTKSRGTIIYGDWRKDAYITGDSHKKARGGRSSLKLKVALLDGYWWRRSFTSFEPGSGSVEADGFNYDKNFEHNYNRARSGGYVAIPGLVPCKPWIVFYGPVTDPYIILGGNTYKVDGTVASGGRIEVDGRRKTVKYIMADGTVVDKFASALRGSGEGGGQYIFQPIANGPQGLTWDDSFGVDVGYFEEVGEVPWSSSLSS